MNLALLCWATALITSVIGIALDLPIQGPAGKLWLAAVIASAILAVAALIMAVRRAQ